MQLYPRASRILADLRALGYGDDAPVGADVLNRFDQLHYHGTDALDQAITHLGVTADDNVLEVGSGWGGCARYIARRTGARVTAVELQQDYHDIGRGLTGRAGLLSLVEHQLGDFLSAEIAPDSFDHVVSWLALFHIPRRRDYLAKIRASLKAGGGFFGEDLTLLEPVAPAELDDFLAQIFPNSLVDPGTYVRSVSQAGFVDIEMTDMTADWAQYTAVRLAGFRNQQAAYELIHGADGYAAIELFYAKMAEYFERGIVGGIRLEARCP